MSFSTEHIAASWNELRAQQSENRLVRAGNVDDVIRAAVLSDGDEIREAIGDALRRHTEQHGDPPAATPAVLTHLAFHALAEAGGWPPHEPKAAPLLRLLASSKPRGPFRGPAVWANLAHGKATGLSSLLPVPIGKQPPDPTETFGTSDERIVMHLVRCVKHRAPADTARAAWRGWVRIFPVRLGARRARWMELLFAARAMHVVFEGAAPETTLRWLKEELP